MHVDKSMRNTVEKRNRARVETETPIRMINEKLSVRAYRLA